MKKILKHKSKFFVSVVLLLLTFFSENVKGQYFCTAGTGEIPFYMVANRSDTLVNGDTLVLDFFLGLDTQAANNINVINFQIDYNESITGGALIKADVDSSSSSWFSGDSQTNIITLDTVGTYFFYLDRLSTFSRSGVGKIASLIIVIDDNLDGIVYPPGIYNFSFPFLFSFVQKDGSVVQPTCNTIDSFYFKSTATSIARNAEFKLELFPNPAKKKINMQSSETIQAYEFYDMMGQLVLSKRLTGNSNSIEQNVDMLSSGIYNVRILLNNERWISKKLTIE